MIFYFIFHISGLNFKFSYQIVSLFDMYIDIAERIAGRQDRPSLIIEHPLREDSFGVKSVLTFWLILVFKLFPLLYICLHCDEGCILLTFRWPWCPWILCKSPTYVNQDGPSLIIEASPPPPPRPPKDVFHI